MLSKEKVNHWTFRGRHYREVRNNSEEFDTGYETCDTCSLHSLSSKDNFEAISVDPNEKANIDENQVILDQSSNKNKSKTPSEIDFFERLKSGEIIDLEIYRQEEKRLSASLAELHQDYAAAVKKNLGQESSAIHAVSTLSPPSFATESAVAAGLPANLPSPPTDLSVGKKVASIDTTSLNNQLLIGPPDVRKVGLELPPVSDETKMPSIDQKGITVAKQMLRNLELKQQEKKHHERQELWHQKQHQFQLSQQQETPISHIDTGRDSADRLEQRNPIDCDLQQDGSTESSQFVQQPPCLNDPETFSNTDESVDAIDIHDDISFDLRKNDFQARSRSDSNGSLDHELSEFQDDSKHVTFATSSESIGVATGSPNDKWLPSHNYSKDNIEEDDQKVLEEDLHAQELVKSTIKWIEDPQTGEIFRQFGSDENPTLVHRPPTPRPPCHDQDDRQSEQGHSQTLQYHHHLPFPEEDNWKSEFGNSQTNVKRSKRKWKKKRGNYLRYRNDLEHLSNHTLANLDRFCKAEDDLQNDPCSSSDDDIGKEENDKEESLADIEDLGKDVCGGRRQHCKFEKDCNKALIPLMNGVRISDPCPAKCPKAKTKTLNCSSCNFTNAQAFYQTMHYEGRYHQWQIQKAFMNSIKGLRVRMGYLKNVKREKSKLQKIKRLQLYDLFLKRKKLKQLSNSMGMNTVESKDYTFSRMETLSLSTTTDEDDNDQDDQKVGGETLADEESDVEQELASLTQMKRLSNFVLDPPKKAVEVKKSYHFEIDEDTHEIQRIQDLETRIFSFDIMFYDNVASAVDNLAVQVASILKHLNRLEFFHVCSQLSKFFTNFLTWDGPVNVPREFCISLEPPEIFRIQSNQDFAHEKCKHAKITCNVLSAEPIVVLLKPELRQLPARVLSTNRTRLHGPGSWMAEVLKESDKKALLHGTTKNEDELITDEAGLPSKQGLEMIQSLSPALQVLGNHFRVAITLNEE